MSNRSTIRHCLAALALVLTLAPQASSGLQQIQVFAAAARERNPAALEAGANLRESGAEADAALGRVLPGISLNGRYARNQYGAEINLATLGGPDRTIVLLPENQWTGVATATVPLVDLPNFQRIAAARTATEGAARRLDATRLEVESAVAQSYYQLVASVALVGASNEALQVSREAWRLAQEHYRAGSAAVLEVDRARAEVEQRIQQVASAELQVAVASRALRSASGVTRTCRAPPSSIQISAPKSRYQNSKSSFRPFLPWPLPRARGKARISSRPRNGSRWRRRSRRTSRRAVPTLPASPGTTGATRPE